MNSRFLGRFGTAVLLSSHFRLASIYKELVSWRQATSSTSNGSLYQWTFSAWQVLALQQLHVDASRLAVCSEDSYRIFGSKERARRISSFRLCSGAFNFSCPQEPVKIMRQNTVWVQQSC